MPTWGKIVVTTIFVMLACALLVSGCARHATEVWIPARVLDLDADVVQAQKPEAAGKGFWDVLDSISAAADWPGAVVGVAKALAATVSNVAEIRRGTAILIELDALADTVTITKTVGKNAQGQNTATIAVSVKPADPAPAPGATP